VNAVEAEYLSVQEFVAYSSLSIATVRRRLKEGKLPHLQFGGKGHRILIPRDALQASKAAPAASLKINSLEEPPAPATPRRRGPRASWTQRLDT
jgi:excisionase family DNA binding protein